MTKINREEYEVLKDLEDKWKWIARDKNRCLYVFTGKPVKKYGPLLYWGTEGFLSFELFDEKDWFQFIQWEDDEPYSIAELIEEYEIKNGMRYDFGKIKLVDIGTSKLAAHNGFIYVKESEETEVKKNKEWAFIELGKLFPSHAEMYDYPDDITVVTCQLLNKVYDILDQLDEPETLSKKWIENHTASAYTIAHYSEEDVPVVTVYDLENLLVPKQEKLKIPYFIEEHIQTSLNYSEESTVVGKIKNYMLPRIHETETDSRVLKFFGITDNIDLVALAMITENYEVEKEQKYIIQIAERDFMVMDDDGVMYPVDINVHNYKYQFTEQEIKDYDERYIPFMVSVDEVNR